MKVLHLVGLGAGAAIAEEPMLYGVLGAGPWAGRAKCFPVPCLPRLRRK
jgi:hypothetical protein